ncbi:MAG TPA: hypothetical protein PKV52_00350, partial [Candidatus Saccharibacteria bacterium]|nr:hypothetical protein [Candidatus Saccharibacteria bacterium]
MKPSPEAHQYQNVTDTISYFGNTYASWPVYTQVDQLLMASIGVGGSIAPEELLGVINSKECSLSAKIFAV